MITPDPLEVAQVLEEAADILLINGRCVYDARDDQNRFCVVGAIMAARGYDVVVGPVTQTYPRPFGSGYTDPAVAAIERHLGVNNAGVWSDETEDDFKVIDTMRIVAKDLRNNA